MVAAAELLALDNGAREGEDELVEQRRVADVLEEARVGPDRVAAERDRIPRREHALVQHLEAERGGVLEHRRQRLVDAREPLDGAALIVPGPYPVGELGAVVAAGLEAPVAVVVPEGAVGSMAGHRDRGAVLAAHREHAGAGIDASLQPVRERGAEEVVGRAFVHRVVEAVDRRAGLAVVPVVLDDPGARGVKARRQRGVTGGGNGDAVPVARVLEQHALIEQAAEPSHQQRVEARQVLVGKLVDRHQHHQARAVRCHRRWWWRGRLARTGGAQHQDDEKRESMYYAHRAARRRHSNEPGERCCQCEVP